MIHEFAHAIHSMGLRTVAPTFQPRLRKVYEVRRPKGCGRTPMPSATSASTGPRASSRGSTPIARTTLRITTLTRARLKSYDPALSKLVEEVFGDGPWRYVRPDKRTGLAESHLAGFEPGKGPRFQWEPELLEARRKNNANPNRSDREGAARPETGTKGVTAAGVGIRSARPPKTVPFREPSRSRAQQSLDRVTCHPPQTQPCFSCFGRRPRSAMRWPITQMMPCRSQTNGMPARRSCGTCRPRKKSASGMRFPPSPAEQTGLPEPGHGWTRGGEPGRGERTRRRTRLQGASPRPDRRPMGRMPSRDLQPRWTRLLPEPGKRPGPFANGEGPGRHPRSPWSLRPRWRRGGPHGRAPGTPAVANAPTDMPPRAIRPVARSIAGPRPGEKGESNAGRHAGAPHMSSEKVMIAVRSIAHMSASIAELRCRGELTEPDQRIDDLRVVLGRQLRQEVVSDPGPRACEIGVGFILTARLPQIRQVPLDLPTVRAVSQGQHQRDPWVGRKDPLPRDAGRPRSPVPRTIRWRIVPA